MPHRFLGSFAVVLGLPAATACSHSSNPPAAAPAPAPAAAPVAASSENAQPTAAECEEGPPVAPHPMAAKFHRHHVLNCPMDVPGTTAAFVDDRYGPSIDFETTGDVAGLRHRVREFLRPQTTAGMIEPGVSADTQGSGGNEMKPDVAYIATMVRFHDLPNGVRATFVPEDDGQLAAVRGQIAGQVVRLDSGDCSDIHIHGVKMKDVDQP